MICDVLFFCAPFWFLQLLTFPNCTLLAAPEPFLWLAVYRWKCQNHQRPQRSQRFQNFLRHRRESGRERGGGPWWIFVAFWPLWRKGLYRFEGLANVSWMWIDSIVLVHVQCFGCHCMCSLKGCWVFRTEQKMDPHGKLIRDRPWSLKPFGGFLDVGTPKSSKVDQFSIEIYGFGVPPF